MRNTPHQPLCSSSSSSVAAPSQAVAGRVVCRPHQARSRSRHACKVAFAPEPSRSDQAHLAADSLIAKSQECVLHYQRHSHTAADSRAGHSSRATVSPNTHASNSSSSRRAWPWSLWDSSSSSSNRGSSGTAGGASLTNTTTTSTTTSSNSSSSSRRGTHQTLLEQSVAAISKQHAQRARNQPAAHTQTTAAWAAATADAAAGTSSTAIISSTMYLQSFTASSSSSSGDSSGTSSSWEESAAALRTIQDSWEAEPDSSSSSSGSLDATSQLFMYDLMPLAAADAVAAAALSSSTASKLALMLGDTYPKAAAGSAAAAATTGEAAGDDGDPLQQRHKQQQWRLGLSRSSSAHTVPLPNTSSLQRSLRAVTPQGHPTTSSSGRRSPNTSSSGSSSSGGGDDADWLTAVLSAPTSRLSSHSNAVLTNSLKRLASLRSAGGAVPAAAAAAVEGAEDLLDSIRARFGTFQLQQFEDVALQLAQLGYRPDPEWLAAFERSSLAAMPGGSPRLLSRLLLSRSKLGGLVSSEWCAACCEHMAAAPHKLSVSSWCNALYALVRLKHTPSRHFQTTFFSATAERLDDVSPELLTHLAWSLARLKLSPSSLWWRSLVRATASVEKPFSQPQLASLVHSVALWAPRGGIAAPDVQRLVDMLLVEIHEHLGLLQPAELTTVVWSLGSLVSARKLLPDAGLQEELLEAIQGQLPRLSPLQCSNLCWGLAKLQHPLSGSFAEALLLEVQAQLAGFSDGSLCSVLWALAKLELVLPAPFRQQLCEELHHRIKGLGLQDLSTLLWALAQLQLQPPEDVLLELCERSAPHIPACDVTHLTNVVWALGRLQGRPDQEWLDAAESAAMQVLPSAGLTQVVNLAWGLSRLRAAASAAAAAAPASGPKDGTRGPAWQAACLRELRLRCVCAGIEVDCRQLLSMLQELGVAGLHEGAAALADRLFAEQEDESYCLIQFQPGCR